MVKYESNSCRYDSFNPELLTKWFGESETNVRVFFEEGKQSTLSTIFWWIRFYCY